GLLGAVWPAAGGGRAALYRPPLPAAGRRLCASDHVARAAEAEDPARPPDDTLAHRGPTARALRDGRPALGRSDHAGAAQPAGRPRPPRPHPGAIDLSARLPPAVDGARASHPSDPAALAAAPGGGDDGAGRPWQGPAPRGGRTGGGQDRWGAAVCGGAD